MPRQTRQREYEAGGIEDAGPVGYLSNGAGFGIEPRNTYIVVDTRIIKFGIRSQTFDSGEGFYIPYFYALSDQIGA
ncbi:MAG: hypothetical protein ACE5NG_12965, partial [bacterium]